MTTITFVGLLLFTQYFGQNKIQYKNFDFKVLSTDHFKIYFYSGGEALADFAEEVLEDGYEMLSEDLGIEVDFTIPVILYNSPNDFSQTNVTLGLIEEGVGGFTEILKNRMVIPFNGDYEAFRHVLVHELTHVFQFVVFFPSRMEALFSGDIFYSVPLWVMEGHCEFESLEWDLDSDIFMRDLVMNNAVVPLSVLDRYGGYLIYKEGQAFFNYIAERYGRKKVGEFIHLLKAKKNLETTFVTLFGVGMEDISSQWMRYYQTKYWPTINLVDNFDKFARIIYSHKKTNTIYNTSTAISSKGDKIAFISDRSGVAEIIIISSIDGQLIRKLLEAEYSSGYEGLHLFQGGLSWSPDDSYISFAARSKGQDVLYVLDAQNGKIHKRLSFALDGIYSPKFSPHGSEIIFAGLKDGYSDIYIVDVESGTTKKITDDIYSDRYPTFSPSGSIAFVSDRPDSNETYHYGSYAVFLYEDGLSRRLIPRTKYVASPFFEPDNGLFFVADYDSSYNLYWYSYDSTHVIKKTEILTGIYYPTISADGGKIAFSYLNDYGYDVCVVKDPLSKMVDSELPEELVSEFTYEEVALDEGRVGKYRTKFTVDYFVAGASYYSALGFSGLGQIALSDMLGNHHIQIATDLYGSLTNSDVFINYWYLGKRIDYGIALFQYLNYFREYDDLFEWRRLGIGGIMQYPFDRFFRVEFGVYAYKLYETQWYDFFVPPEWDSNIYDDRSYNFLYPNLAFIFDNVTWAGFGPHHGRRVRLSGYATVFSDFKIRSSVLDYRRYFRLSPRSSFATRLVLAGSFGTDVDLWSIGGPLSLRGFDYYEFTGSKLGFINLEYRFPFIDRLKMSFPLPLEFRNIRGVLFADFGGVYTDSFKVYETEGGFQLQDLKMGIGGGIRFSFMYLIFKFDYARAYNFSDFTDDWKFHFTIGPEW